MGAPKQKWRQEEEAALKAGVLKHGAGKWRTILKDPEFSEVLHARSNVDLKDKWRNLSVTANGWGSRERGRTVLKRIQQSRKQEDSNSLAITTIDDSDGIVDVKPLRASSDKITTTTTTKRTSTRLENLIMEAITSLKEPTGSNKTSIALYIEDQYWSPPNFKRILSAKLKALTASRKLIKVKRKYRIAPGEREWTATVAGAFLEGRQEKPRTITKAQVEAELARIRSMTAGEAAVAAAQAVAEAEAAIAEAEAAAREAEKAEAEAEEAQAFAEAAMMALKSRNAAKLVTSLSSFSLQAQPQQI
ncbi:single myb histone 5-like [Wolffia australiana]